MLDPSQKAAIMKKHQAASFIFAALCASFVCCAQGYAQPRYRAPQCDSETVRQLKKQLERERAENAKLRADYEKKLDALEIEREKLSDERTLLKDKQEKTDELYNVLVNQANDLCLECQKKINCDCTERYNEGYRAGADSRACPVCPACNAQPAPPVQPQVYQYNNTSYSNSVDTNYNYAQNTPTYVIVDNSAAVNACETMSQAAYNTLLANLDKNAGDLRKLDVIKDVVRSGYRFTADQVIAVLSKFTSVINKHDAAVALYPAVCDKNSWYAVSSSFNSIWWDQVQSDLGLK